MIRRWVGRGQVFRGDQFLTGASYSLWVDSSYPDSGNPWAVHGQLMVTGGDLFILEPLVSHQEVVSLVLPDQSRLQVRVVGFNPMTGLYPVAGVTSPLH